MISKTEISNMDQRSSALRGQHLKILLNHPNLDILHKPGP